MCKEFPALLHGQRRDLNNACPLLSFPNCSLDPAFPKVNRKVQPSSCTHSHALQAQVHRHAVVYKYSAQVISLQLQSKQPLRAVLRSSASGRKAVDVYLSGNYTEAPKLISTSTFITASTLHRRLTFSSPGNLQPHLQSDVEGLGSGGGQSISLRTPAAASFRCVSLLFPNTCT